MTCLVRTARLSDADDIGVLHVQAWRETYAGIMPAPYLASLSTVRRAEMWRGRLNRGASGVYVCEVSQAVVGFGLCGPQRPTTLPDYPGEIYAINILRRAQGRGLGRELMRAMARHLVGHGLSPILLLVLACAVIANVAQVGLLVLPRQVAPDIGRLNPARSWRRIYSSDNVLRTAQGLVKAIMDIS